MRATCTRVARRRESTNPALKEAAATTERRLEDAGVPTIVGGPGRTLAGLCAEAKGTVARRPAGRAPVEDVIDGATVWSQREGTATARAWVEPVTVAPAYRIARPVMLQGWKDLASIHWPYDPALVQALLPDAYRVDTFDGVAWVGVIPFRMERIRLPGLAPLGCLSTFPETNVRTYVVDEVGRRGVWFASLDVSRLLPALVARATYQLPYAWAHMAIERSGDELRYASRRRWPRGKATSDLRVRVGARLAPEEIGALDHFLTARWALGYTLLHRPLWAEVEHEECGRSTERSWSTPNRPERPGNFDLTAGLPLHVKY